MRQLAPGHVTTNGFLQIMTRGSFNLGKTDLKIAGAAPKVNRREETICLNKEREVESQEVRCAEAFAESSR